MSPAERAPFSAMPDRAPLKLPGDARVVIWTVVNLEVWDISRPMPRQVLAPPTGQTLLPDVPHWSWHEYGMRAGVWRFFDLFERLSIRPTLSINARVCEAYPRVAEQARGAGWEFMGHVWDQLPMHKIENQRSVIHRSLDTLERFTGQRPRGWLGPGLTQTLDTPDLLAEAGVKYIGDWVWDDEPVRIQTKHGSLTTLPYSLETNDIATLVLQQHESSYWLQRARDAFDRLYLEGASRAKILAIAIHPYITGQPHRIRYLEEIYGHIGQYPGVLHWNGDQILDWYNRAMPEVK
jgi:peptidoglycan/xylan/chitin deacetylase (PgdA/CDA1 family)